MNFKIKHHWTVSQSTVRKKGRHFTEDSVSYKRGNTCIVTVWTK